MFFTDLKQAKLYARIEMSKIVDSTKNHPCGKCTWVAFTNDDIAGCFKSQTAVSEKCDEYTEE
jgi:hypothetical protein